MRKITRLAALAFRGGNKFTMGNTAVTNQAGVTEMFLHGNRIAIRDHGGLRVTLAGWNTPTTRERVNGLLEMFGYSHGLSQKNFGAYYAGVEIDPSDWVSVSR